MRDPASARARRRSAIASSSVKATSSVPFRSYSTSWLESPDHAADELVVEIEAADAQRQHRRVVAFDVGRKDAGRRASGPAARSAAVEHAHARARAASS